MKFDDIACLSVLIRRVITLALREEDKIMVSVIASSVMVAACEAMCPSRTCSEMGNTTQA